MKTQILSKQSVSSVLLGLVMGFSATLAGIAQPEASTPTPPPAVTANDDTTTDLFDGIHQPVMKTYIRLGYQIDLFSETLGVPDSDLKEIKAGGVVYHAPRLGGMYRLGKGADFLENSFIFGDYTFLSQPVKDQRTEVDFTRSTHFLDAGLGHFIKLLEDRIEIGPYIGMSAQLNFNDRDANPEDESVYYHANQNRLGFGLGSLFSARFDDTLPFPLFFFANAGVFPFTPVQSSTPEAIFPDNLTVVHLTGSFYGRFLPYLGGEIGFRQQFHVGANDRSSFNAAWSEFFAMIRFEPEILFQPKTAQVD